MDLKQQKISFWGYLCPIFYKFYDFEFFWQLFLSQVLSIQQADLDIKPNDTARVAPPVTGYPVLLFQKVMPYCRQFSVFILSVISVFFNPI